MGLFCDSRGGCVVLPLWGVKVAAVVAFLGRLRGVWWRFGFCVRYFVESPR